MYESVIDCNLCNIKQRKSGFLQLYIEWHIDKVVEYKRPF